MSSTLKQNKYEIDMCNGTIMDKLISFSLPLMLSGILQLMFNAVDIIVVGKFSGNESLAAVGSTTALINVFTNLFIGISLGQMCLRQGFMPQEKIKKCQRQYIPRSRWRWSAVLLWPLSGGFAQNRRLSLWILRGMSSDFLLYI